MISPGLNAVTLPVPETFMFVVGDDKGQPDAEGSQNLSLGTFADIALGSTNRLDRRTPARPLVGVGDEIPKNMGRR